MFKEIADIKTSDQLKLPVPEAEYETVVPETNGTAERNRRKSGGNVQKLSETEG